LTIAQVAKKIVNECLQVKEDEQVLVSAWNHTIDYANALALEVEKAGGTPLVTLDTDEMFWGHLTKVSEAHYGRPRRAFLSALEQTDASVFLGGPEDPSGFRKVPGIRLAKSFESEKAVMDKFRDRKIRSVDLPVGQMTSQRAKTYGFNLARWRRITDNAMSVDHRKMSALGQKVAAKLGTASKVNVSAKNGTDLSFTITGRPVHVHDGIVDPADVAKGTYSESLPSGNVAVAAVEDSAQGTIAFDQPMALRGKLVRGLKWKFENGKLTSTEAKANLEAFTGFYSGATGDKDRIGWFSIGINPRADFIGYFTDGLVLGAVSVGVGSNKDLGGNNDTTFAHSQTLSKPTVEVDGTTILADGKLKI